VIGIIAVIVIVVAVVVLSGRRRYEPVVAGAEAVDFTLPDMNGRMVSLRDLRGKVVFLNFWATWCKPCEEEIPSMRALYEGLREWPFEIVAVSLDKDSPPVAAFAKKYNINFIVLRDANGRIKELYKTTGVPETFIIDQNGVIAEKVWGPKDWADPSSITTIVDLLKNGPKTRERYKARKTGG
ncbi:MAG: TlpA disulfide reductase family protein, partial [Deltaproteobacteria bacterium]